MALPHPLQRMCTVQVAHELLLQMSVRPIFGHDYWGHVLDDLETVPMAYARVHAFLGWANSTLSELNVDAPAPADVGPTSSSIPSCAKQVYDLASQTRDLYLSTKGEPCAMACALEKCLGDAENAAVRVMWECMRAVADCLHDLQVSKICAHLGDLGAMLRLHAVEYERIHFEQRVTNGTADTETVVVWLRHVVEGMGIVTGSIGSSDYLSVLRDMAEVRSSTVACDGRTDTVVSAGIIALVALGRVPCPDTLQLDTLRTFEFGNQLHATIRAGVVLLTVQGMLRYLVADQTILQAGLRTLQDVTLQWLCRPEETDIVPLLVVTLPILGVSEHCGRVLQDLWTKNLEPDSLVYRTFMRKTLRCWLSVVRGFEPEMDADVSDYVRPVLIQSVPHARRLQAMFYVHMQVHGSRYALILDTLLAQPSGLSVSFSLQFPDLRCLGQPASDVHSWKHSTGKRFKDGTLVPGKRAAARVKTTHAKKSAIKGEPVRLQKNLESIAENMTTFGSRYESETLYHHQPCDAHDAQRIMDDMRWNQGFVGYSKDLPDCTYVAAKTGYYQTRWGLVYWHSDGSVSKVDIRDPAKCRCGYTHG